MAEIKIKRNMNMMEMRIDPLIKMVYVELGDLKGEIDIDSVVTNVTGKTKEEIIDSFIQIAIQKTIGVENIDMVNYLMNYEKKVKEYIEKANKNLKEK